MGALGAPRGRPNSRSCQEKRGQASAPPPPPFLPVCFRSFHLVNRVDKQTHSQLAPRTLEKAASLHALASWFSELWVSLDRKPYKHISAFACSMKLLAL